MPLMSQIAFWAIYITIKLTDLLATVIFVDVLLSWILSPFNKFRQFLDRLVDPILRPFRNLISRFLPPTGGMRLDFSPMLAIVVLQLIARGLTLLYNYIP